MATEDTGSRIKDIRTDFKVNQLQDDGDRDRASDRRVLRDNSECETLLGLRRFVSPVSPRYIVATKGLSASHHSLTLTHTVHLPFFFLNARCLGRNKYRPGLRLSPPARPPSVECLSSSRLLRNAAYFVHGTFAHTPPPLPLAFTRSHSLSPLEFAHQTLEATMTRVFWRNEVEDDKNNAT